MRFLFLVLFGLGGCAVLVALGLWQLDRMAWKRGVIADIEARLEAAPTALPEAPDPEADRLRAVTVEGAVGEGRLRVFGTWRGGGAGHRVVVPLETPAEAGGRRILVDLGVSPEGTEPIPARLLVTGNLDWPAESGGAIPDPDGDLWFGRDVPAMAAALGTEPVMVVARTVSPAGIPVRPAPVGTAGIPDNHLGYAVQWFGLALVWAGMTAFLGWRMTRPTA
ncbi:SURF1 family protein [Jannaschia sp. W003]|uniref:SURF1 family protein n=1 Tax=Jannaschia sp. W003 TaxID=2867012 RepID=UPI0021A39702|nr:SURF1 family protein [Jannaschia sp. W003]UWQ21389.1 SURF1 family protein [Jannaschia sp. W003]